ncbi:MAG: ribonuclease HIII [Verrucomicrobiota bacterium]
MAKPSEPKKRSHYTIKLNPEQMTRLQELLDGRLWAYHEVDYAHFGFKGENVNVVGYESGKLVVQGKGTEDFVTNILEAEITGDPQLGYEEVHHPEWFEPHAGLDESGKGDLFGPLISATVIADGEAVKKWMAAGVRDSKAMGDREIMKAEKLIRETPRVVAELAYCGMARYNELMAKPSANLNRLLGWLHSKSLHAALKKRWVPRGLLDQFSKRHWTREYLTQAEGAPEFQLDMRTKAESDPVVAAASICARAEYVRQMDKLSEAAGEPLLKGASAAVKAQAKRIVQQQGDAALANYAKLHFKTAYEARGLPVPKKPSFYKK